MNKRKVFGWQKHIGPLLALSLFFVVSTDAQKTSLETVYDKVEDHTTISPAVAMKVRCGYDYEVTFSPYFMFNGSPQAPRDLINYAVQIESWGSRGSKLFDGYQEVPFLAGENRFSQSIRGHKLDKNHENAYVLLTKEQLSLIANSSNVSMKLGGCTTSLSNKQILQIRELRAKAKSLFPDE